VAQAGAIGVKVPLQGPGPHGQAGTGLLAVTVAHGIQDPIQVIVRAIDRVGRPRGLRTVIGGREVFPMTRHLGNRLGQRPVEGGARPLGQPPQALGELGFRHGVIDRPGAIKDLVDMLPRAARVRRSGGKGILCRRVAGRRS